MAAAEAAAAAMAAAAEAAKTEMAAGLRLTQRVAAMQPLSGKRRRCSSPGTLRQGHRCGPEC